MENLERLLYELSSSLELSHQSSLIDPSDTVVSIESIVLSEAGEHEYIIGLLFKSETPPSLVRLFQLALVDL